MLDGSTRGSREREERSEPYKTQYRLSGRQPEQPHLPHTCHTLRAPAPYASTTPELGHGEFPASSRGIPSFGSAISSPGRAGSVRVRVTHLALLLESRGMVTQFLPSLETPHPVPLNAASSPKKPPVDTDSPRWHGCCTASESTGRSGPAPRQANMRGDWKRREATAPVPRMFTGSTRSRSHPGHRGRTTRWPRS